MPDWNQILEETKNEGSTHDIVRRKYLAQLFEHTGRNTILYYSGWLQKKDSPFLSINDADKSGFMTCVHELDKTKGLDLILHTPGGELAACESIVEYLHEIFGKNIRAIVPQLAMSAGTMMACACKSILMGKQSSLGPIDPQYNGIPAHGVVEEFTQAKTEMIANQATIPLWQPIIAKYQPAFIGECIKSIQWSEEVVSTWLKTVMFARMKADKVESTVRKIMSELGDHAISKSHNRHLGLKKCEEMGLKIEKLENDQILQDLVLSVHHACVQTLTQTTAVKLIENHTGKAFIQGQTAIIQQVV